MIAGDLPLFSPKALELLCAPVAGNGVVVVPDHHRQGTNALLCSPPHALTPRFGRDSFRRHLAAARVAELQTRVLYSDTLSLDLDSPDDFEELRRRCASTADIVFTMMQGQYTTPALACARSEEHTSELQSLMRISYAVFCLKKKNISNLHTNQRLAYTIITVITNNTK